MAMATSITGLLLLLLLTQGGKLGKLLLPIAVLILAGGSVFGGSSSSSVAEAAPYESEDEYISPYDMIDVMPTTFSFSSGAGGWSTQLEVTEFSREQIRFEGHYSDSDMGSGGEGYSGTIYFCDFDGAFGEIEKVDDYTYRLVLQEIGWEYAEGDSWVEDEILHYPTTPYGLADAYEVMLYLPGHPTADLTEDCLSWICMPQGWSMDNIPDQLECYVLYNVNEGLAFTAFD